MALPTRDLNGKNSMSPPYREKLIEVGGLVSKSWEGFFRAVFERLNPLGIETSANLTAHATESYAISGLKFNYRTETFAVVDYIVQRVNKDTVAAEKNQMGMIVVRFNPVAQTWTLGEIAPSNPGDADVTFSIDSTGQVKANALPFAGVEIINRISWRARVLRGSLKDSAAWA